MVFILNLLIALNNTLFNIFIHQFGQMITYIMKLQPLKRNNNKLNNTQQLKLTVIELKHRERYRMFYYISTVYFTTTRVTTKFSMLAVKGIQ